MSGPEILDDDSLAILFATLGAADIMGALALGCAAQAFRGRVWQGLRNAENVRLAADWVAAQSMGRRHALAVHIRHKLAECAGRR